MGSVVAKARSLSQVFVLVWISAQIGREVNLLNIRTKPNSFYMIQSLLQKSTCRSRRLAQNLATTAQVDSSLCSLDGVHTTTTTTMAATPASGMEQTQPVLTAKRDSMPTEVLDEVAMLLPRSALGTLALISKKTYMSATDVLYKTYLNRTAPAKAPFHLFLRTLCERPDLAARVKRVDIRGWRSEYEVATGAAWRGLKEGRPTDHVEKDGLSFSSMEKTVRGSSTERSKLFVGAAVKAGLIAKPASLLVPALKSSIVWYATLREDVDFMRLLVRGAEDAHLVLMLALLPNLDVLIIAGLSPFPLLDWNKFLSRSTTMALQKLSLFYVQGSINTMSEPVVKSSLQILDIMPNLQSIRLFGMAIGGHSYASHRTLPSRKLTCLVLGYCGVNARLLQKLLDGQRLDQFAYLPDCVRTDEIAGGHLALKDILVPLASSKTTPRDVLDPEVIKALLVEQIPPTMATLYLRYLRYTEQTRIILEQLVQLKVEGVLQALKTVRLNFFKYLSPFDPVIIGLMGGMMPGVGIARVGPQVKAELQGLFEEAGIALQVYQSEPGF